MSNDRLVQTPPIAHIRKIGIVGTAALVFGLMVASTALGAGTRISDAFEPFEKSPNERVAQAFEDINDLASITDELKTALALLSQSVQGPQKPPVQAQGNE
ncbi:hypothetical protein LUI11_06080 [Bradyrhizobium diazoefficiens]|jgi:hypothetical protein|uniref:Uncharacterized protein n=1 Tax=Bradyrhizobium diazoefficiens TaxID=1355477 RepID=A0A810D3A9_9BRAD|nr:MULTISPECIES: hypothetical protein [Bradyrhizobium]APO52720.1 hypothetical protein BD122_20615 [Bradyrhizobium diazoefficiens]KOY08647.1 hypothetical protein AF336_19190 [Bradyrhizobium diazoefficiens]MCD9294837.1 hypothetical protein [Bradyrhizobium diazoefficiens]MCD9810942.1 hypothetical protein [Bradyrhizobium diazoefficiens]MCD9828806.1 hypothetical protein [Bradyrhizobium diazoefficiens]